MPDLSVRCTPDNRGIGGASRNAVSGGSDTEHEAGRGVHAIVHELLGASRMQIRV